MRNGPRRTLAVAAVLLVVVAGCGGSGTAEPRASVPAATPSSTPDAAATPFPDRTEPVAIEPGTYRIASSAWSDTDFSVTFPEGWTVQHGHVYASNSDEDDEFGFYAVVVGDIFADACEGETGGLTEIGPSVDDLAEALLRQPGPTASDPVDVALGGYQGTRIDLIIPEGLDLEACSFEGIGLQVWYSAPADKYFVLLADATARVYIVDVDGQRQVFLAQHRSATSDDDLEELESVLDSIRFEE